MPSISVYGGNVFYNIYGREEGTKKPAIIIFAGMAMVAGGYEPLAELLAEKFQVVVPNHRGLPPSDAPLPPILTVRKVHEDTLAILAELKIKRVHVLGESYGGMLAMSFAEYFPAMTESMFIINSSLAGNKRFRLNPRAIGLIARNSVKGQNMWRNVAEAIFSKSFQSENSIEFEAWLKKFGRDPFPHRVSLAQTGAAALYHGKGLPKVEIPAWIITSDKDTFVSNTNSKKIIKLLPNSEHVVVPGLGHHACGEDPQAIADVVIERTDYQN